MTPLIAALMLYYPPTPTPMPSAPIAPISIPYQDFRIWSFADDSIMVWQVMGTNATQVIQIAVIVVILIASITLLIKYVQSLTEEK